MIQKKICLLGGFGVGKTSLVSRYVHSIFSDKYLTTVGVKIDKKSVTLDGTVVDLVIWDIYGQDDYQKVRMSYLRGAAGYLLVADGTRRSTLDTALALHDSAQATQAPRHVPSRPHPEAGDQANRQQLGAALRGRRPSGLPLHDSARLRAGGLPTPRQRADTELRSAVVNVSEVVRRRDGASCRNQGPPSGGQVLERRTGRVLRRWGHLVDLQAWRERGPRVLRVASSPSRQVPTSHWASSPSRHSRIMGSVLGVRLAARPSLDCPPAEAHTRLVVH